MIRNLCICSLILSFDHLTRCPELKRNKWVIFKVNFSGFRGKLGRNIKLSSKKIKKETNVILGPEKNVKVKGAWDKDDIFIWFFYFDMNSCTMSILFKDHRFFSKKIFARNLLKICMWMEVYDFRMKIALKMKTEKTWRNVLNQ